MSAQRFAPEVEAALRAAGWSPDRLLAPAAMTAMREAITAGTGRFGGRLMEIGFADPVLAEFGGLVVKPGQSGVDLTPQRITLDPGLAARYHVETLIDAGRALGVKLCPVGVEGLHEAVLAVTDRGSVVAIDPTGEWLLGETFDEALDLLITGRRPRPALPDGDPRARQPALDPPGGAAFLLPRTPANLPYVWLPNILVRIGIVPAPSPTDPGRFQVPDWGELACEVYALDLERHTVLLLGFDHSTAIPPSFPAESPVAQAFRIACAALTPELAAAFVWSGQRPDLPQRAAEWERAVLAPEAAALLDQGFGLVYLPERAALRFEPAPAVEPRDELPISGGRLFLAPPAGQPAR